MASAARACCARSASTSVRATVATIEKALMVDGFVRCYDIQETDVGLPLGVGGFVACSFWLANDYATGAHG